MSSRRRAVLALALAFAVASPLALGPNLPGAHAQRPTPKTFVSVLSAAIEVPRCLQAGPDARGVAVFRVLDQATGLVHYLLVANNLPGTVTAAHIHVTPPDPGPVVQPLPLTPGAENGVIGEGTFTNPELLAALQADPRPYYVNVHSDICPRGVIRGQLDILGPSRGAP